MRKAGRRCQSKDARQRGPQRKQAAGYGQVCGDTFRETPDAKGIKPSAHQAGWAG